jgi:hypothetical protein
MDQRVLSFDAFKHHLQFARQMIFGLSEITTEKDLAAILVKIKQTGNNVMDLYIGSMTVEEICQGIIFQLNSFRFEDKNDFAQWLEPLGYRTLELSDNSFWILRFGIKDDSYIHVHPAKFGENVIRITGSAWKTALATAIFNKKIPEQLTDLKLKINYVRSHFLDMSPVKKIIPGSNLETALKLLRIL